MELLVRACCGKDAAVRYYTRIRKVPGVLAGRLQMLGWELELGPHSGGFTQGEGFGTIDESGVNSLLRMSGDGNEGTECGESRR